MPAGKNIDRFAVGVERAAWWTRRITGVALLMFAAVHLTAVHLAAGDPDYGFVAARWRVPLWRLFDLALLALAVVHGGVGFRTVVYDHVRAGSVRTAAQVSLALLAAAALVAGIAALFAFKPGGPAP